jgi:hypothetical protein
MALEKK